MAEKFNEFEKYILEVGVNLAVKDAEIDILDAEFKGKGSLFASGYFEMVGKELKEKIGRMTKSSK